MIIHGMWDLFGILESFGTTKSWNLFHHTDRFTLLTVVSHVEELFKTGDKHSIDNWDWSGEYLQASMDLTLLTKIPDNVFVTDSGPEILVALILVIHASNFEILDKLKDKLDATKLSDFIGENVELYCDHQLGILQRLSDAGFLQPRHVSFLTLPLTWCTSPAFQLWALNQNKVVSEFRFKTQHMEPCFPD